MVVPISKLPVLIFCPHHWKWLLVMTGRTLMIHYWAFWLLKDGLGRKEASRWVSTAGRPESSEDNIREQNDKLAEKVAWVPYLGTFICEQLYQIQNIWGEYIKWYGKKWPENFKTQQETCWLKKKKLNSIQPIRSVPEIKSRAYIFEFGSILIG